MDEVYVEEIREMFFKAAVRKRVTKNEDVKIAMEEIESTIHQLLADLETEKETTKRMEILDMKVTAAKREAKG